ncbi:hypothetical protein [Gorillibacterium sp. sgz5001074]|uniref:hypothetical protein n=1 Tax=Gorillibacterium sp. sgz5001074 TaxID=3446695 RepID=UPI003F6631CA
MTMPLEHPNGRILLDDAAVLRLKRYIERKHPGYTSAQRAAVLADAVHRIVDRQLPDFDDRTRGRLRRELLRRAGLEKRFTLMSGQVLEACRELKLEEDGIRKLTAWAEQHQLMVHPPALSGEEPEETVPQAILQHMPGERLPTAGIRSGRVMRITAAACTLLVLASLTLGPRPEEGPYAPQSMAASDPVSKALEGAQASPGILPAEYAYRRIDEEKLRKWLESRSSLLGDEPYFSAILQAAAEHNIHPLLLFAITGQEQGYVPKDGKRAQKIANNPFNVHHSWETYNTDIADSARIASQTILTISRSRPDGVHPIQWLNTRYAEDPNWWIGVTSIFEKLKHETEAPAEITASK